MPIYKYECPACHCPFEVSRSVDDRHMVRCPKCKTEARLVFGKERTMTVRPECHEKGRKLMNLYNYAYEIYGSIAVDIPVRGASVDWAKNMIRTATEALEMYYQVDKLVDEATYRDIRTRLQDIEGRLPADIKPWDKTGDAEERLKASKGMADGLTEKIEDVLFQVVAECECRR